MRKILVTLTLLATTSTALTAMAAQPTANDQIAMNYGLCQELKFRAPKGDEDKVQVNCDSIIKLHELNIEKAALQRRIKAIDVEAKAIQMKMDNEVDDIL
jgi:peptidoglycan hydrolase CwlO-like protein